METKEERNLKTFTMDIVHNGRVNSVLIPVIVVFNPLWYFHALLKTCIPIIKRVSNSATIGFI